MTRFLAAAVTIILIGFFMMPQKAHGFLTARIHGAVTSVNPADFNNYLNSNEISTVQYFPFVGADALLKIPTTNLELGLRYDYLGAKMSSSNGGPSLADVQISRLAALAGWDLMDNFVGYIRPVMSVGLSHTDRLNFNANGVAQSYDGATTSSYSAGLDVGLKLGVFVVGAEAGYQYWVIDTPSGSSGVAPFSKVDLSGAYLMASLGLTF